MPAKCDLTGLRFGRLTVLGHGDPVWGSRAYRTWLCRCDCGQTRTVATEVLTSGRTVQCQECVNMARGAREREPPPSVEEIVRSTLALRVVSEAKRSKSARGLCPLLSSAELDALGLPGVE